MSDVIASNSSMGQLFKNQIFNNHNNKVPISLKDITNKSHLYLSYKQRQLKVKLNEQRAVIPHDDESDEELNRWMKIKKTIIHIFYDFHV